MANYLVEFCNGPWDNPLQYGSNILDEGQKDFVVEQIEMAGYKEIDPGYWAYYKADIPMMFRVQEVE